MLCLKKIGRADVQAHFVESHIDKEKEKYEMPSIGDRQPALRHIEPLTSGFHEISK